MSQELGVFAEAHKLEERGYDWIREKHAGLLEEA